MLHTFILLKSWSQLTTRVKSVYIIVLLLALGYAIVAELYGYLGNDLFLQILIHGLLVLAFLGIYFPNELVEIQKNEITAGPFGSEERKQQMLQSRFLNVQVMKVMGVVAVVVWGITFFIVW